ncbi:MAG: bifunctional phosphopantothenoylcysteine decarboxylase/phosphopantothenate--cysteine ligase CoaBC [Bdellovibrionales bacterium]|nr:bifunctional phosphopantothenoylcysteine decarboxylase/phosphopantothenate--cysteine ligase CoaBC [Bdellovibrionales bacterium]
MSPFEGKKILLILSGSIACFKAAALLSLLKKSGAEIKTVTTSSALKFIGEATLEGLSGNKNYSETFEPGRMMEHIELSKWADLILVYPASANLIGQWANGLASDLASTLLIATEEQKPVYCAPAMNSKMWAHQAVQKNIETLESFGVRILEPEWGQLACGEVGPGRILEPESVIEIIKNMTGENSEKKSILITYGGTTESIDSVRYISNFSTGETGRRLSEYLSFKGHHVFTLRGERAARAKGSIDLGVFGGFEDIHQKIKTTLNEKAFDVVIHMAAVSDYSLEKIMDETLTEQKQRSKLSSDNRLLLQLKPNMKILNQIKEYSKSSQQPLVVGFKLTAQANPKDVENAVEKVFKAGGVDFVVHNDLQSIGSDAHRFSIFDKLKAVEQGQTKEQLFSGLETVILTKCSRNLNQQRSSENALNP